MGTDLSRLVQVASMLLAARYSNRIPLQWLLIKGVASLDCTETQFNKAISHLVDMEFLEIQQVTNAPVAMLQDASKALATCLPRGEERREETEERQRGADAPLVFPEGFAKEAWEEWIAHRRAKRWPTDNLTLRKQIEILGRESPEAQREMIDRSINAGWQGIFPPKGTAPKGRKWVPPKSIAELEAEEAARGRS
jgi:hypothetical protein